MKNISPWMIALFIFVCTCVAVSYILVFSSLMKEYAERCRLSGFFKDVEKANRLGDWVKIAEIFNKVMIESPENYHKHNREMLEFLKTHCGIALKQLMDSTQK